MTDESTKQDKQGLKTMPRSPFDLVREELIEVGDNIRFASLIQALEDIDDMKAQWLVQGTLTDMSLSWMVQHSYRQDKYKCSVIGGLFDVGHFNSGCVNLGCGEDMTAGLAMVRALVVILKSQQRQPSLLG